MYCDHENKIIVVTEGAGENRIETSCGVTVSPVAPGEVIVYWDSGERSVFDLVYGSLPDGSIVAAIKDDAGEFPSDTEEFEVRFLFDPYQLDSTTSAITSTLSTWNGDCPICGRFGAPESGDDEGGDDDEPFTLPMPPRFLLDFEETS